MKRALFFAVTLAAGIALSLVALWIGRELLLASLRPQLVSLVATTLTAEERQALVAQVAGQVGSFWEVTPEPLVARLGQPGARVVFRGGPVQINAAGLASRREYDVKPADVFRIVCLGDSYVMGSAGLEEDRFCDQLEQFYAEHAIEVEGRRIEALALGLGSWTAIQSASYLTSRLSDYAPDLILVLTVANDVTDATGVTGQGFLTSEFAPEQRARGSGVFVNQAGARFGERGWSAITTDLSPEARRYWVRTMSALRRLTELQHARGGKILHSVLDFTGPYFVEAYKRFYHEVGIDAPGIVTAYDMEPGARLAHDTHPSRRGHAILAAHYAHTLDRLGWLQVPDGRLPPLPEELSLDTHLEVDREALATFRAEFAKARLKESLDFRELQPSDTLAFLGGFFPDQIGPEALHDPPWASVRSGFLLRAPESPAKLVLELRIPSRVELFPLQLSIFVDGQLAREVAWGEPQRGESVLLEVPIPERGSDELAAEILIEADRYFTTIRDGRMRSFQLLSARFASLD
jgi:hypothetical protein